MSVVTLPNAVIPTFLDHCVVNPDWLATASRQATLPPFDWHPKIAKALDLVAANARDLDCNVYRFPGMEGGDVATNVGNRKRTFFKNQSVLHDAIAKVRPACDTLFDGLRSTSPDLQTRSLHTFAAAASLSIIRQIQRFEGSLFSDAGDLIVRIFPDVPSLQFTHGPMIGLPFQDPLNEIAYGSEAMNGFLYCRICRGAETDYESIYLPRFDAEAYQDSHPGPSHLYYGWVLPQWLLTFDDPPPDEEVWWISIISDEQGTERFTRYRDSPWSGPHALRLHVPSAYPWPDDFYFQTEIAPRMPSWVKRATFGQAAGSADPSAADALLRDATEQVDPTALIKRRADPAETVLCVVAAQAEFSAVLKGLTNEFGPGSNQAAGGAGYAVRFVDPQTRVTWYVACLTFQAAVDAVLSVTSYSRELSASLILMVGMCMGMPMRQLKVGTVIVPNEVTSFDHQRLTREGPIYRPHGDRVDKGLYRLARIVGAQTLPYPVVVDKGLASSSAKVEHIDTSLVQLIEQSFPDAVAYDMEGWGFYRASDGMQSLWIKAIADSGEAQGQASGERAAKNALQADATLNALDFAIRLIRAHCAAHTNDRSPGVL
ncbi:hypothetical protein [Paraburkholderia domus]|jgi:Nucleoside phosphorylase|uniref:hypothetical protein n=1 Tax=Paraburkholderia domus TaxID=2793075 RepID=UPI00191299CE|nr:hypothetical protein [Paraburkholderia domus]MBK5066203.1 hypothetical protein [Burkholderia sp. R-70199]CAE6968436.1 hypothetical protein R70199_07941 [Paraburkholderia domus]